MFSNSLVSRCVAFCYYFLFSLGGKKCVKCGQRVFHDKWNVPPRLAEERWAHQEARKREIAEVAEFLGFD